MYAGTFQKHLNENAPVVEGNAAGPLHLIIDPASNKVVAFTLLEAAVPLAVPARPSEAEARIPPEEAKPKRHTLFLPPDSSQLFKMRWFAAILCCVDCVFALAGILASGSRPESSSTIAIMITFVLLIDFTFVVACGQANVKFHTFTLCGLAVNFFSVLMEGINDVLLTRLLVVILEIQLLWNVREQSLFTWFSP